MTALLPWLSFDAVRDLAWTLVHFLWQGLLLAVLLRSILPLCRGPAARHDLAVGTLLVMCVAPIATLLFLHRAADVGVSPTAMSGTAPVDAVGGADFLASTTTASPWTGWVVAAWCTGIVLLCIRALAGWYLAESLRRHGTSALPIALDARFSVLARRMSLRWPVRLLQSTKITAPVVVGWFRPVILIPIAAIAGLHPQQLDALILHELAHIRRRDAFTNILLIAVETVLFYHPAVWWVGRCVRVEREHCCDDAAVAISDDPAGYVEALAALDVTRSATGWALASNGSGLKQRAARLLGTSSAPPRLPVAAIIGLALLGLTIAGVAVAEDKTQASAGRFEIHVVDDMVPEDALQAPLDDERFPARTPDHRTYNLWVKREALIDGNMLAAVHIAADPAGYATVRFFLTEEGGERFAAITRVNMGHRLAAVVDGTIVAAPTIKEEINGGKGQISGNFTETEARMLAARMMGLNAPPAPSPDATSTLCRFTAGPRANQLQDQTGSAPRRIGLTCQDERGSTGEIIAD